MGDLHLGAAETGVVLHDGSRAVIEANLVGRLEPVGEELGTVGLFDLHALACSTKLVLLENVVLRPPRSRDLRLVGAKIRQEAVPKNERRSTPTVVRTTKKRRFVSFTL